MRNLRNVQDCYKNDIFGGSILKSNTDKIFKKNGISNNLENEIRNSHFDVTKGGGFYIFKDVKYAANVVVDIWMLLPIIFEPSKYKLFKEYNGLPYKAR